MTLRQTVRNVLISYDFANLNGGQAMVALTSAKLLADAGLKVHYLAATGTPDPLLDHPNIELHHLGQKDILTEPNRAVAMSRGLWNHKAAKSLKKLAAKFDPADTIHHCHGYAKALSPAIGPELTNGHLRSVYTMHEYFLGCPNGGFYDYQANEICTRKALSVSCLKTNCDVRHPAHKAWRVARQVATWGPGQMPRNMKDVIYISQTQRRAMAPYFGENTRLHYLPNPAPLELDFKADVAANDTFLFIGRLNPEKGGLLFAKAAREAGVKAVFCGDGAEADAIRAENPDAIITGWQTPDQVDQWIRKARCLVFPSLWYEGQPLVPLEALTRGVPVIAGRWTAASESITDGVNGYIMDTPSLEELTAKLKAIANAPLAPDPARGTGVSQDEHLSRLVEIYDTAQA